MLSFLYVRDNQEDWPVEELTEKTIMFYTYIIDAGWDESEFGDICLGFPMGYLMRIG